MTDFIVEHLEPSDSPEALGQLGGYDVLTPGGSTSVQEMLRELPERNDETTQKLAEESRREAMRWAADEIQCEFTEATWAMFWLTSIEGESVAEVARQQNKSPGAVYMARFKVMQRLKEKLFAVSEVWSDVK